MFSGIVEDLGSIRDVRRGPVSARLRIATRLEPSEIRLGDSISVDGACLTVVGHSGDTFEVDAAAETLARTTLGEKAPGDAVHLELALRLGDRLGGHLVTGHVDGVGRVAARREIGPALEVTYAGPPEVLRYVVVKGSIAVDGVSLTVNAVEGDRFRVVLIPHTLKVTHLGRRLPGARVNLEADLIGKYVERLIRPAGRDEVDLEILRAHGYAR
jgi:riboflavin synthase